MRIFEPKAGEVTEGPRSTHNEDLSNLYPSPDTDRAARLGKRWVR
jgi:hypothetical protein